MKLRTVYSSNARGRYVAREELRKAGPVAPYWAEVSRVYESEMLLGYPTEVLHD
jgi:hypothetical protein